MKFQVYRFKIIFTILSILFFDNIYSQIWPKIYGNNIDAYGKDLLEAYDNGYLICGSIMKNASQFKFGWIIKTDINGNILWDKKFGNQEFENYFSDFDKTEDSGFIISGATAKLDIGLDPLFIKLNVCGEIEWCKIFLSEGYNTASAVITLTNGEYLGMLQYYRTDEKLIRISLVKMDSNGEPIWIKYLAQQDSVANEEGFYLYLLTDNNYLISGSCLSPYLKPYFINTDTSGEELWNIKWPTGYEGYANQCIFTENGNLYSATGLTFPDHPRIPYLLKFNETGDIINQFPIMGDTIERGGAKSLLLVDDTTIYVGLTWTDDPSFNTGYCEIFKTDTNGNLNLRRQLLNDNFPPRSIIKNKYNKIVVMGYYYVDSNWDIYMWKMNANLEDDTLYAQPLTYDSLCPYEIQSDTVDLDCDLFVNIDELPTKEEYESTVKISPNPAHDWVALTLPDVIAPGAVELTVYNILGKEEIKTKVNPFNRMISLDISYLSSGMYLVICKDQKNRILTEKLIIKR